MIFKILSLLSLSTASVSAAGPSISGGADGCGAKYFEYECTVKSDNGDGSIWKETYTLNNDSVTPTPIERLEIGICADKGQRYAWLNLSSRRDPSISATAQIDITDSQKNFSLLVSLYEGTDYGGNSYYKADCKKIK